MTMAIAAVAAAAGATALPAPPVAAADYRLRPLAADAFVGGGETVTALAGDVDGDGHPDLVVGRPDEGAAHLVSGRDGSVLFTLRAEGWAGSRFGAAASGIGDLDGDGAPDLAVAAPGVDRVFVFGSSLGYGLIEAVPIPPRCGWCEPAISIVPLDAGIVPRGGAGSTRAAGFLMGVPGANGGSGMVVAVVARSGATEPAPAAGAARAGEASTGSGHAGVLSRLPALAHRWSGRDGEKFGFSVAPARGPGGEPAALVGAPGRNRAVLVSLATGRRLAELVPASAGALGQAVATLGDVDGDAVADFAAADPGYRDRRGRVVAFSGANGSVIWSVEGAQPGAQLGSSLAAAGDVNGDGVPDAAAAVQLFPGPGQDVRQFHLLSGRDGQLLGSVDGPASGARALWRMAPAGDLNGDGLPDLFVGLNGPMAGEPAVGYLALSGEAAAQAVSSPGTIDWHSAWLLVSRQGQQRALVLEGSLEGPVPPELARGPWEVRIGPLSATIPPGNLAVSVEAVRLVQPVGGLEQLHVDLAAGRARLVTRWTDILRDGEAAVELGLPGRRWSGVVSAGRVARSYLVGRPASP